MCGLTITPALIVDIHVHNALCPATKSTVLMALIFLHKAKIPYMVILSFKHEVTNKFALLITVANFKKNYSLHALISYRNFPSVACVAHFLLCS